MLDILEVRDTNRKLIGVIDTADSIVWKSVYYGVGIFSIYIQATPKVIELLKEDYYITRTDGNEECGIIETIEPTTDSRYGSMLTVSGRFAKSILDRRIIYDAVLTGTGSDYYWTCKPTILQGKVETAVRNLINLNAVNASDTNRNIEEIYLSDEDISGLEEVIMVTSEDSSESAEKQVSYKNLLTYTDSVLQEYSLGAKMWLDRDLLKFRYKVFKGVDRSRDTQETGVKPITFSTEFDNLESSTYRLDKTNLKTTALIGGEGEGEQRYCAFAYSWIKGLERREQFVDAKSLAKESRSVETYRKQLEAQGQQSVAGSQLIETFEGKIDLKNSIYKYGEHFKVGDIVSVEDVLLKKYINPRIIAITEVKDSAGYSIDAEFGA